MKKIIIVVLILIIGIIGVIFLKNSKKMENINEPVNEVVEEPKQPEYVDDNPITIGLYNGSNSKRVLVKDFKSKWPSKKDIETFTALFTNDETVSNGYIQNVFYEYYNKYENASNYHIGYHIKFTIDDGTTLEQTILTPKDTEVLYDYLETYMYNGPQKKIGQWYSHVTEEEYTESTILASIKLTAGSLIHKITADIELTAFTYNGLDDFDENGNYRGNSSYKILVKKIS